MALMAEDLDGQNISQMTRAVGKNVDHAIGKGVVVEPEPGVFAIQIDMKCDYRGCDTKFEARLFDGPATGDWAHAVLVETGEHGDLRNHVLFCDEHEQKLTGDRVREHNCAVDDKRYAVDDAKRYDLKERVPYGYRVRKGDTEEITAPEKLLLSMTELVSDWLVEQDEYDGADTIWDEDRKTFVIKLFGGSVR